MANRHSNSKNTESSSLALHNDVFTSGSITYSQGITPQFSTIEHALVNALAAHDVHGLSIQADGHIYRFAAPNKSAGNQSGWYACHGRTATFGFWHTGYKYKVSLSGGYDPIAGEEARQKAATARREQKEEQLQKQQHAAFCAQQVWNAATPADPQHPYLVAKSVQPHSLRQQGDTLLVPLYADGKLVSLQRIQPDGKKRFFKNGQTKGAASLVGSLLGATHIYLAEGWATAATIHETTSRPVVATMSTNNLEILARRLRLRLPMIRITIAADNDRHKTDNPGLTYAKKAAAIISADITWPDFYCDDCDCTDFNDLAICANRREVSA